MQKWNEKIVCWSSCFFAIIFWSITFVNTRSLLLDFSALEIMFIRFALAWAALCGWAFLKERGSIRRMGRCELLFAAMGLVVYLLINFLRIAPSITPMQVMLQFLFRLVRLLLCFLLAFF